VFLVIAIMTFGLVVYKLVGICTYGLIIRLLEDLFLFSSILDVSSGHPTRRFLPRRFERVGSSQLVSEPNRLKEVLGFELYPGVESFAIPE